MINKKKSSGLEGLFYLVDLSESHKGGWWNIRMVSNHYTLVAVESKKRALDCLYKICKRYKTDKVINKFVRRMDYKESPEDIKRKEKQFREQYSTFKGEVEEVVTKAMNEINGVSKKPFKKISGVKVVSKEKKEEVAVTQVVPIMKKVNKKKKRGIKLLK